MPHAPEVRSFVVFAALVATALPGQATLADAVLRANALREQAEQALQKQDDATARPLIQQALAALDASPGADGDAGAAHARWLLATAAYRANDHETEAGAWAKAAAYYGKHGDDPKFAREARRNQADALGRLGRHQQAYEIQQQAYDECRAAKPPDAQEVLRAKWDLAVTLNALNRSVQAVALWDEVLAELKARQPVEEDEVLKALASLASALEMTGQTRREEAVHRDIIAPLEALGRRNAPAWHQARLALAWTLQHAGQPDEAVKILREVLAALGAGEPAAHLHLRSRLGYALWTAGNVQEARSQLEDAVAGLRRLVAPTDGRLMQAEFWLADTLSASGERSRAIDLMTDHYQRRQQSDPPHGTGRLDAARSLAVMWRTEGDLERARLRNQRRHRTRRPGHPVAAGRAARGRRRHRDHLAVAGARRCRARPDARLLPAPVGAGECARGGAVGSEAAGAETRRARARLGGLGADGPPVNRSGSVLTARGTTRLCRRR